MLMRTSSSQSQALRTFCLSTVLTLLITPNAVASSLGTATTPVCVEQALNEFENGGSCSLGDLACYCSTSNTGMLMNDIEETCVNDSEAQSGAASYVQSFCQSITGGGGGKGGSTSTSPGGYPTTSPSYITSTVPTLPGGVLPPTTDTTSTSTQATPSLLPSATSSAALTSTAASGASSSVAIVSPSLAETITLQTSAVVSSAAPTPTSQNTATAAPSPAASAGKGNSDSARFGFGLSIGVCVLLLLREL